MERVALVLVAVLGLVVSQAEGCKFKEAAGSGTDINLDGHLSGIELSSGSLCYDVYRTIKESLMKLEVECDRLASTVTDEEVEELGSSASGSGENCAPNENADCGNSMRECCDTTKKCDLEGTKKCTLDA